MRVSFEVYVIWYKDQEIVQQKATLLKKSFFVDVLKSLNEFCFQFKSGIRSQELEKFRETIWILAENWWEIFL